MLRATLLFAFVLLGCAAPETTTADVTEPPRTIETVRGDVGEQVDRLLGEAAAQGFSGAAIVELNGEIVFAGGYGWADREARRPFTVDTVAQIGSITKTFTGAAIADLVRRGLVDLDQPAGRYLPGASEPGASVPLRLLLSHRSGMSEYCGDDYDLRTSAEVRSVCMAQPLDREISANDGAGYSNTAYSVLAAIVEQVSGETIEHYVASHFLAPAGIREDGYGASAPNLLAAGYLDNSRSPPISERLATMHGDYWNLKGNGGMQLSARAMHRWHLALSCRAPMDPALRELILHPIVEPAGDLEANRGTLVSYGYGWAFRTTPNGTRFKLAHGGSDGVFLAQYFWRPYDGLFVYIVSNIGEDASRPTMVALRRLLGDSVQLTDQDVTGRTDPWRCST